MPDATTIAKSTAANTAIANSTVANTAIPNGGEKEPVGRLRIIDAAADLFVAQGYAETSLRDIAAEVDMKAGSLYYHFASKDDLLVDLLERGIGLMIAAFDRVAAEIDPDAEPADVLLAHVTAHLRTLHANHPVTTLHVTTFRNAPEAVRAKVVPERDGYEAKWTALLSRLLPDRTKTEIGVLRLTLFGAMNASIEWFDAGRGNLDRFARLVTEQFWSGVAPASQDRRR